VYSKVFLEDVLNFSRYVPAQASAGALDFEITPPGAR